MIAAKKPATFRNITVLSTLIVVLYTGANAQPTLRIGVYENPPKVFSKENDDIPAGIFIDIINHIAEQEHWNIEYVTGTWQDGLDRLIKGDIDLMPDVAFSEERNRRFDFNKIPVLSSWLQMYGRKKNNIISIDQLEGKTVAVLGGSIQQQVCRNLQQQFNISFSLLPLPDYQSTIEAVEQGKADAVIVGRFYGFSKTRSKVLQPCPIILHPSSLHYVVAKRINAEILDRIDHHLSLMTNNPKSVYYESLNRWLHTRQRFLVPQSITYILIGLVTVALLFIVFSLLLKRQVNNRTRELRSNNVKLQEALETLSSVHEKAIRQERLHALGQLTSGIAHDFNNLLAPIVSYTDLLLTDADELDDKVTVRRYLDAISDAAQHGTELVRRMRSFSKSSVLDSTKEQIDIDRVIDDVLELASARLKGSGKKPVKTTKDFQPHPLINANRTQLHEMILNLLLNAADAMPKGGTIEITTKGTETSLIISIRDNGTGMSEEVRLHCLQPFYTTKGEKGTGMGLAMVNNIVSEYGGTVEIDSTPGAGTAFTITLPVDTVT